MRAIEMSGKTRHQGLHQRGTTVNSVIRLGEDLISALSALDAVRKSLHHYVIKKANGLTQAQAVAEADQVILDGVKGLLLVSDRVMSLDDLGRDLRREHAKLQMAFNTMRVNCGDVFKENN